MSMELQRFFWLNLVLASTLVSAATQGDETDTSWELGWKGRYFFEAPQWTGQDQSPLQNYIVGSAEWRWQGNNGQRIRLTPRFRLDSVDSNGHLVDAKEVYWAQQWDNIEFLVGINTVFWGVTESLHLVDIINQNDALADIDGEQKLGQPMLNLAWQNDWGLINLYALPYFRERSFASQRGRLRAERLIDSDAALYESPRKEHHIDYAARYSHYFDNLDIGIGFFKGTHREARLIQTSEQTALTPYYDQIQQVSTDLQLTLDAWLWKLEAIYRSTQNDDFAALVSGFEFTQYQIFNSGADLGYLLEYQWDDRAETESLSLANNDLFIAGRLALNDTQDSSLLAGFVYDRETHERFINLEGERRFGHTVISLRARAFVGSSPGSSLHDIHRDDYIELALDRYF